MNNEKKPHKEDFPLVSIIVITYNSARFVLETLESAKAQTYENIELIVSDDASTDDTVEVCRKWLDENKGRFVRTELITVPENTGIPANCNRGLRAAKGEWIKYIAGDDALLEDAIALYINFILNNRNALAVQAEREEYHNCFHQRNLLKTSNRACHPFTEKNITAQKQYNLLLYIKSSVRASTFFAHRDSIIRVNGFDERVRLIEDKPMWIRLTKAGIKIHYMNTTTVKYRRHSDSVQKGQKPFTPSFYAQDSLLYIKLYVKGQISSFAYYKIKLRFLLIVLFNRLGLNRNNGFSRFVFTAIQKLT